MRLYLAAALSCRCHCLCCHIAVLHSACYAARAANGIGLCRRILQPPHLLQNVPHQNMLTKCGASSRCVQNVRHQTCMLCACTTAVPSPEPVCIHTWYHVVDSFICCLSQQPTSSEFGGLDTAAVTGRPGWSGCSRPPMRPTELVPPAASASAAPPAASPCTASTAAAAAAAAWPGRDVGSGAGTCTNTIAVMVTQFDGDWLPGFLIATACLAL